MRHTLQALVVCVVTVSSAVAQNEADVCRWLFTASAGFTSTAGSAIELAAEAVFGASNFTGTLPTLTGTLTEVSPDSWTYSGVPGTKLVIVYYGGPRVEYTFTHWEGWTGGSWQDFVDSHHMTFTVGIAGALNLSINSVALPPAGGGKTNVTREINGSMVYAGASTTLALLHTGTKEWEVDVGYASYKYTEKCTGSASTAAYNATIDDQYYNYFIHNSNNAIYAGVKWLGCNSSLTTGGTTYKYNNGSVDWAAWTDVYDSSRAGIYNMADQPSYWKASGTLSKNGAQYGTIQFSGPVVQNSYGPVLVLAVPAGSYLIHPLLQWWLTGVEDHLEGVPGVAGLMQNYPNPFNPTTTIMYHLPASGQAGAPGVSDVKLVVYDLLGREVAVLVNERKAPGSYEVTFDATGLASGVFVYRLQAGNFVQSRTMLLVR